AETGPGRRRRAHARIRSQLTKVWNAVERPQALMLTVRDLLADLDVRLVTGDAGLDLPVRWVHISELLDPTPWLSGGEVLLTTGMSLDTAERQREFVARLADHKLAGVGVGPGLGLDAVPQALLRAAAERDFPGFEGPHQLP